MNNRRYYDILLTYLITCILDNLSMVKVRSSSVAVNQETPKKIKRSNSNPMNLVTPKP